MKFKKGDKVFHKNLKLFGIFVKYLMAQVNMSFRNIMILANVFITRQNIVFINLLKKWKTIIPMVFIIVR